MQNAQGSQRHYFPDFFLIFQECPDWSWFHPVFLIFLIFQLVLIDSNEFLYIQPVKKLMGHLEKFSQYGWCTSTLGVKNLLISPLNVFPSYVTLFSRTLRKEIFPAHELLTIAKKDLFSLFLFIIVDIVATWFPTVSAEVCWWW